MDLSVVVEPKTKKQKHFMSNSFTKKRNFDGVYKKQEYYNNPMLQNKLNKFQELDNNAFLVKKEHLILVKLGNENYFRNFYFSGNIFLQLKTQIEKQFNVAVGKIFQLHQSPNNNNGRNISYNNIRILIENDKDVSRIISFQNDTQRMVEVECGSSFSRNECSYIC